MNLETIKSTFNIAVKYPHIKRVGVFGSYSRGEENPASDLDILLEYDNSSDEYMDDLSDFMEAIEQNITAKIDYVTYNGLMRKSDAIFRQSVLNDVKWLYVAN
ncbi:MAG: nucleotidyltransferase domain-containing protein [Lachnospiraceae bacterium]|nr:nucleotidyltransferase domain-containing protein [Lachnospiraceae bacterium]